jgi:hypothetical protein
VLTRIQATACAAAGADLDKFVEALNVSVKTVAPYPAPIIAVLDAGRRFGVTISVCGAS